MESTEEIMDESGYRIEAAYNRRTCSYLVYAIRMNDYKTIVRTAHSKKEVVFTAYSSLKKLGYGGGVTPKDITWRFIGEAKQTKKKLTDSAAAPEMLDVHEDNFDVEDEFQGISEEQPESGELA